MEAHSYCLPMCWEISLFVTSDNFFSLVVKCMLDFCGLKVEELARKLVNIGCDESNVFQGHRTSMTTQFKDKVVPFIIGMHCFAHQTNLVVITLSNVLLLHWLEGILQSMYVCFSHSLKKFTEFQKLVNLFNMKGKNILWNVKTHYMSMFFPSKIIYSKYRPLIMKMHVESLMNDTISKNLNALYDMEFLLGLPCLLPLFECVHKLIKIAQGQDVFVCDLVEAIKLA